jgi:hypothetical protein
MHHLYRNEDGTVDHHIDEAPFRFLEENPSPSLRYPPYLEVRCLLQRTCIQKTLLTYDPIHRPNEEPQKIGPLKFNFSFGAARPTDSDRVKQALRTLLRLNAAPPFEPGERL